MDSLRRFALLLLFSASLLDPVTSQALVRPLLTVFRDGTVFAVTTPEGTVQVRDVDSGELLGAYRVDGGLPRGLEFGSNRQEVRISRDRGPPVNWNWRTKDLSIGSASIKPPASSVTTGEVVISIRKKGVEARDVRTKAVIWTALPQEEVLNLSTKNGQWIVGTASGRVVWGRLSDGVIEQSWSPGHGPVMGVESAGNDRWLVLGADFSLALWDGVRAQILGSFGL